ncbi:hypothetical protein V8E36_002257 [Tilletia maclaganii]
MAAPALSLFALRVPAGGEVVYPETSEWKDFVISSITYAEELPPSAKATRTLVRIHHTPIEDDNDDFYDDDDDSEDDEADGAQANGKTGKKLQTLGNHSLDVSTDEIEPVPEELVHTICALTPTTNENITGLNVHCAAEDLVGFSVTGPYAVDLIGAYIANPAGMNEDPDSDDDEEIDSDIYGESDDDDSDSDSDEDQYLEYDDDDDDEGALDPALAGLLNPEDSGEEDAIEDPSRFQEIPAGKKKAAAAAPPTANGKKRAADTAGLDTDGDASMVSAASSAAADGDLTRNQRKRLNKKLKAQSDAASAAADESTASTASAKAKKVSFKEKEAESAPAVAAAVAAAAATAGKKEKAEAAKKQEKAKPAAAAAPAKGPKKTTTATGLVIEDVKVGTGPQAKPGQRVGMRYIGKLTNGKPFDANTSGKPFYFKLGRGEVIKGWDEGVKGMTIGSERRLTCPPQLAYGGQKLPGIPANSTLVFDVKLVDIK